MRRHHEKKETRYLPCGGNTVLQCVPNEHVEVPSGHQAQGHCQCIAHADEKPPLAHSREPSAAQRPWRISEHCPTVSTPSRRITRRRNEMTPPRPLCAHLGIPTREFTPQKTGFAPLIAHFVGNPLI